MEETIFKHEFVQFDLKSERKFQTIRALLELHPTHLVYDCEYYAEEPKDDDDDVLGWEEKYNNFTINIKRSAFVSVEKYWKDDEKYPHWKICLEASGFPNTINFYFKKKDQEAMLELYKKIFSYIFE